MHAGRGQPLRTSVRDGFREVPWPALSHADGAMRELFNGPRSTTGLAFGGGMCQRPAALLVTVVRSPLASDCAGARAGGLTQARRLRPSGRVHATAWWRAPGGCDSKAERAPAREWAGATWVAGSLAGARLGQTSRGRAMTVPRPAGCALCDDHMMLPLIPKLRSKHRHLRARATEIQVGVPTEVPGPLPSAMQHVFKLNGAKPGPRPPVPVKAPARPGTSGSLVTK